ncbi:hypothetical protein LCGC14_1041990 [marine sediment metagenome]|uniref:Ribose 5-phosphate isomerase B n=1 Tax=marine sediment metagenome TaxID=412755 RepID=A0A0F9QXP6_9ZZZZ|nr:ribose 5-phosphate isomerase B [Actinomycetota bacterium]
MKISIGADHAGFTLKQVIGEWLKEKGHEVVDKGPESTKSVDYPDFALAVAGDVANNESEKGILVCGSGVGVTIVANKVKGIRAANCYNEEIAALSRAHNDANVLTIGARFVEAEKALQIVEVWLDQEFEGERHQKRLEKIANIERENG